jgi:signal transduction histidine kinase
MPARERGTYSEHVLNEARIWLRLHPWSADWLLAALLLGLGADQWTGDPAVEVVSVLLAATVIPRRRYPVAAFGAAAGIACLQVVLGLAAKGTPVMALQPSMADAALAVLLYNLAARCPSRTSVSGLAACLALSGLAITRWPPAHGAAAQPDVIAAAVALGGTAVTAWVIGDSVAYRYRRVYLASLEERAARLEAERDAQARIAAAAERARELQERRALAVDESAARLRRIERDLHDGAQVRLAALAMTIGEIKETLDQAGPAAEEGAASERTRMLVSAAHRNAKETLAELRDLARGIHPPVLDRGLPAALAALAETSPTPVELTVSIGQRPSPAIEAIAYFCAAELLANIAKHSGAACARISVTEAERGLEMTVTDDGSGGARLVPGGGLAGLLERVQTVDGRLTVASQDGGPTVVTVGLPVRA